MKKYLSFSSREIEQKIKSNKEEIRKLQKEGGKLLKALEIRKIMETELEEELEKIELGNRKRAEDQKIKEYNLLKEKLDTLAKELGVIE